jgi:hypothetical protein
MDEKPDIEPAQPQSGFSLSSLLRPVFILLVAYPLSIGPAMHLSLRFPRTEQPLTVLYAPIVALYKSNDLFRAATDWYIGLWGIK